MNEVLMGIVVDAMAFFELSGDGVVDPDSAVGCLESISAELQRLEGADRAAFLKFVRKRADKEKQTDRKEFLRILPESAGLLEE